MKLLAVFLFIAAASALPSELNLSAFDITNLNSTNPEAAVFQCFTDVLGEASIANGLESMWSEAQPELQLYLDNWKKCSETDDQVVAVYCNMKGFIGLYSSIVVYVRNAALVNQQVWIDFARGIKSKCFKF